MHLYTSTGFHRQLTDAASGVILKLTISHHDSTDFNSKQARILDRKVPGTGRRGVLLVVPGNRGSGVPGA